jgi:hypothetical protein
MMLLFKKWVVSEKIAQSFLREHNGFNFIIKRLFYEPDVKKSESFTEGFEFPESDISSDESE